MKPTAETPTPDLDMMLLRAGWPAADSARVQQIRADQMYRSRQVLSKKIATLFAALANWFEQRAERPATSVQSGN